MDKSDNENKMTTGENSVSTNPPKAQKMLINVNDLSPEELYNAQKILILQDIQNEVEAWAKKRGWIIAAIAIVAGTCGFFAFINQAVSSRMEPVISKANEQIIRAELTTERANKVADETLASINETQKQISIFNAVVEEQQNNAKKITKEFEELLSKFQSETSRTLAEAERRIASQSERMKNLQNLVSELASRSEESKRALEKYHEQIRKLDEQVAADDLAFMRNKEIKVDIVYDTERNSEAARLNKIFLRAGFQTSTKYYSNFLDGFRYTKEDNVSWIIEEVQKNDLLLFSEELLVSKSVIEFIKTQLQSRPTVVCEVDIPNLSFHMGPYSVMVFLTKR